MIRCILIVLFLSSVILTEKYELKFSLVVWRHGDGTPITNYPGNQNNDSWLLPPGQLTTIGMKQHYDLGRYLRKRYSGFISDYYLENETYIISDLEDRTIESALSNMAGLFPPKDWQSFDEKLRWQPIPIHTPSSAAEYISLPWEKCDSWLLEYSKIKSTEEYEAALRSAEPIFEVLFNKTGVHYNLDNLAMLTDVFICEDSHKFRHPPWFNELNFTNMIDLALFRMEKLFGTKRAQEIIAGPLLYHIRHAIIETVLLRKNSRKLLAFSGHDTNIASLSLLLGVFNYRLPTYASALFFEVYTNEDSEDFLRISIRNSSSEEPFILKMPLCKSVEYCPLQTFLNLTEKYAKEDFWNNCVSKTNVERQYHLFAMTRVAFGLIFVVLTILLVVVVKNQSRASTSDF